MGRMGQTAGSGWSCSSARAPSTLQPVVVPQTPPTGTSLARDITLYTLGRLGLVAVIAGLLVLLGVPLLVAILLGLVVALPLSLVLMRSLRARVSAGLNSLSASRRAERNRLRAQLSGEQHRD